VEIVLDWFSKLYTFLSIQFFQHLQNFLHSWSFIWVFLWETNVMKVRCLLFNCYHCNQSVTKHVPINGTICSCFNIQWQDLNISFKNKRWKQPMSLFNIILLTLKIGNLLIIYQHENGLKEFQVKYGFLNVPFTCINLFRKFHMFIELSNFIHLKLF